MVVGSADGAGWGRTATQPPSAESAPNARPARRRRPPGEDDETLVGWGAITRFSMKTLPERHVRCHLAPVCAARACYNAGR